MSSDTNKLSAERLAANARSNKDMVAWLHRECSAKKKKDTVYGCNNFHCALCRAARNIVDNVETIEALEGEVAEANRIVKTYYVENERLEAALDAAEARAERLRNVSIGVMASLAAAISLLERGGKAAKKAAPSDKMFDQMLIDYKSALERARKALEDDKQ